MQKLEKPKKENNLFGIKYENQKPINILDV